MDDDRTGRCAPERRACAARAVRKGNGGDTKGGPAGRGRERHAEKERVPSIARRDRRRAGSRGAEGAGWRREWDVATDGTDGRWRLRRDGKREKEREHETESETARRRRGHSPAPLRVIAGAS